MSLDVYSGAMPVAEVASDRFLALIDGLGAKRGALVSCVTNG
jgi:hypothetical protein